jgi:hypothetical protein
MREPKRKGDLREELFFASFSVAVIKIFLDGSGVCAGGMFSLGGGYEE